MKMTSPHKFFLLVLSLILTVVTPVSAQDSTAVSPAETTPVKLPEDFLVIDFTMDRWLDTPDDIGLKTWSPGISISLYRVLRFGQSTFSAATGLTFSSHNVFHNGIFVTGETIQTGTTVTTLEPFSDTPRQKSSASYIELPLELRVVTRSNRPLRLHVGAKGGFLVNFHQKLFSGNDKVKTYDRSNMEDYRYGVYARLGWNYINLYGYYGLTSLIRENRGDQLYPVSLGLSLTL